MSTPLEAHVLVEEAAEERHWARVCERNGDAFTAGEHTEKAVQKELEAIAVNQLADKPRRGTGGEILVKNPPLAGVIVAMHPTRVNAMAARERLEILTHAKAAELGVDLAEEIKPKDKTEKLLVNQFAALHKLGMQLIGDAQDESQTKGFAVEKARLANAGVRCLEAATEQALAIARLRNGGAQKILVQYVHVSEGGQAVVGGEIRGKKA